MKTAESERLCGAVDRERQARFQPRQSGLCPGEIEQIPVWNIAESTFNANLPLDGRGNPVRAEELVSDLKDSCL